MLNDNLLGRTRSRITGKTKTGGGSLNRIQDRRQSGQSLLNESLTDRFTGTMKPSRNSSYQERVKARERLKTLEIADVARSPQSVISHGLLTKDRSNTVDLLALHGA